jgi:predicted glycosyltransferase
VTIWIDIENPPQVQYLLPVRAACEQAGVPTIITARDYGATAHMLRQAGVEAEVLGAGSAAGKLRKVTDTLVRARQLRRFIRSRCSPQALVTASRPAALAARWLKIPSFILLDYEFVNLLVYRLTGSIVLHPEVIDAQAFCDRGLRRDQLRSFRGLKEDLTFGALDLDQIDAFELPPGIPRDAPRVIFRPPSETSHYYTQDSGRLAHAALAHLAQRGALVLFAPRQPDQISSYLDGPQWPLAPERPVPFASLLKCADAVVCSGGTMLREAAYLGIPAYSIFQSRIGAVDRWLERSGRAILLHSESDLSRIELGRRKPQPRLDTNPGLAHEILELMLDQGAMADRRGQAAERWLYGTGS